MKTRQKTLLAAATLAALWSASAPGVAEPARHAEHPAAASPSAPASISLAQAGAAQRDLWLGHVFWVRNVVRDTLAGDLAAANAAESEVVANARQIAAAIEPFYGKAAAEQLFGLLAGHYGAVKQYLDATAAKRESGQETALQQMSDNADAIATFLSGANPHLPKETVRGLLLAHGGHHVQEIQQLHERRYAQEARTWEAMKAHMYVIADALAGALAKQFPTRFG